MLPCALPSHGAVTTGSPSTAPAAPTITSIATNKFVFTQRCDGSWSVVSVPSAPRLMITPAPAMIVSRKNHLPMLRGQSGVVERIARYLGVRPAVELGRLRAARDALAALAALPQWRSRIEEDGCKMGAGT